MTVRGILEGVQAPAGKSVAFAVATIVHGGDVRGEFRLDLVIKDPSGLEVCTPMSVFGSLTGPGSGDFVLLERLEMRCPSEGVYWMEISFAAEVTGGAGFPRRVLLRRPLPVKFLTDET